MIRKKTGVVWLLLFAACAASAQTGQWTTFGHDPQRSGVAGDEHAFTPANVSSMGLDWKTVVPNQPLYMNGLTAPLVVRGVKTGAGEKNLLLVAGSSDHVFALDAETGELAWKADFAVSQTESRPADGGWLCPYALNATPVIEAEKAIVYAVSSDGRLHTLDLGDGHAVIPPTQFVPAFSKMWSLNLSGGVLYSSISQGCNHAASGVVAIDPGAPGRPVATFYSAVNGGAGIWGRGGVSIGFDGSIYGATGDAPFDPAANEYGDTVLKLAPRTLRLEGYYTPSNWEYITRRDLDMGTSTPVVFRWNHRVLAAVGGKEGAIYLTDTAQMSGPDHHATAYISPRYTNAGQTFQSNGIWGEMTAWTDAGQSWLYVPSWGAPTQAAQFPISYGPASDGSIMAFTVVTAADGKPMLKPAWISSNIAVPDPAVVAGGVLFVLGTGENTRQVNSGDISRVLVGRENLSAGHAILHALDAHTGKELWSSGDTITGWTHFSGLAAGEGKIFATTHDGAIYAFGLRTASSPAPRSTVVPGPPPLAAAARASAPAAPAAIPQCGETNVIFAQRCAMCHGADGKGIAASHTPDFTDPVWQAGKTDKDLIDALTNGTDNGMPAFGGQISPTRIDRLVHCLLRGLGPGQQR